VADWIRSRRLERCRRDLLDPALATRTVEAIGERWGLTDAAHFSRVFRRRFGAPPAEYRLLHTPRR
jgi:AraC-like DNA-binding protein